MGSLLSYSGLTTKIRAMQSKLLTNEDYAKLSQSPNLDTFVRTLQQNPSYLDCFDNIDSSSIHRGILEKMLILSNYKDFSKIYRFAGVKQRQFLNLYFIKYEIQMLKRVMRSMGQENIPVNQPTELLFGKYSDINLTALYAAKNMNEFVNALRDTKFYNCLSKVSEFTNPKIFDYEIALDLFYFSYAWKKKETFYKKKELKTLTECMGSEIDAMNIMWIYRSKKYYDISSTNILSFLIPINYKLKKEEISALCEAPNLESFKSVLNTTHYLALNNEEPENETMEKTYEAVLHKIYTSSFRKDPYSIACINSYMYLKDIQMKKLITIAECIRYQHPSDFTLKQII